MNLDLRRLLLRTRHENQSLGIFVRVGDVTYEADDVLIEKTATPGRPMLIVNAKVAKPEVQEAPAPEPDPEPVEPEVIPYADLDITELRAELDLRDIQYHHKHGPAKLREILNADDASRAGELTHA